MLSFFEPYFMVAYSGAYSLLQNLQGLGILSIWYGPYIDLQGTIAPLSGLYFICLLLVILFNIISSFAFSRKFSFSVIAFWLLPGVFSLGGFKVFEPIIPEDYIIGSGHLGTSGGALINALVVFVFSWSLATLCLHSWRAGKKSKATFDHIWYVFGLSALAFFVSDTGTSRHHEQLTSSKGTLLEATNILSGQLRTVSGFCEDEVFAKDFGALCVWSNSIKWYVNRISDSSFFYEQDEEKPTIEKLLSVSSSVTSDQVARDIERLNAYCTNDSKVKTCVEIPIHLNQDPALSKGTVSIYSKYIVPINALAPTIERYWTETVKLSRKVKESEMAPHKRWMFFMLLAFLVGIKVANSSRELFSTKDKSVYRSSAVTATKCICTYSKKLWCRLMYCIGKLPVHKDSA